MKKLKEITEKQFIDEILNGRRFFEYVKIEPGSNFSTYAENPEIISFFNRNEPFKFNYSDFSHIKTEGLNLQGLKSYETKFIETDFSNTWLNWAYFFSVDFTRANFKKAELRQAELVAVNLRQADLEDTKLWFAKLHNADLRGVKNLEKAIGLETISYNDISATEKEKKIIMKAFEKNFFPI